MKTDEEKLRFIKAQKRVQQIKEFYSHLLVYMIIIPILIVINLKYTPNYHWFWFSMIGWGVGLALHALQIFEGYKIFLGQDWEENKIKELMKQDYKNGK
ncbi:2TM domain-containing protein [Tenacibaculum skagerrakense]|uniref:2TM domain-containing protein n=1 Tax=Tenacibaculum skagerrakense TaxID=186571 RepID=A0A4R2NUP3_9FLAO|nr:2TM domain-containing protein [Tenacibaculum skagerrakense]TCP25700.1 2TM domain-containing protein [Tenacibaculum skagerrakense]